MLVIERDPDAPGTEGGDIAPPSSFLQTPFWASFKEKNGWKARYFIVEGLEERNRFSLTVLVRSASRFAAIAYIPLGPDIALVGKERQAQVLSELAKLLQPLLPRQTICVRFDPPWGSVIPNVFSDKDDEAEPTPGSATTNTTREEPLKPLRRASADVQPPDTVILDLRLSEAELLSGMKPKWRYNVRLGEKKGIVVRCLTGMEAETTGIDAFYALYLETADRDGIAIHSKEYYRSLVRHEQERAGRGTTSALDKPVSIRVYLAEHEGDILASIVTIFCGEEAVYLYGASSNVKRNLMPAYSLQWKAIRDAKEAGCARYDFYGIPPEDDPAHPMYGLYRFKTGFGGFIVHRVGSLDAPIRPVAYMAYRIAEAARAFWFKKAVKAIKRAVPRKS